MTETKTLSKEDIAAFRKADVLCIHLNQKHPTGLIRLIKSRNRNVPFSEDQEWQPAATAAMERYDHKELVQSGAVQCFGHVTIYSAQQDHASCVLRTLRVGDEVRFSFYPDAHTTQYTEGLGLHGDVLFMNVYRDGKRYARWELDHTVCPDNSARMCRGVPYKRESAT